MAREPLGIYLHIPFCARKCPYCDFYSVCLEKDLADRYADALIRAVDSATANEAPVVDTIYFGGGTPSLFGAERISRVLEHIAARGSVSAGAEITLEANPGSVTREEFIRLREAGITRVSFGVQSGVDSELEALGRSHTAAEAGEAIRTAYEAGIRHLSADLMLAIPGQSRESLEQSMDFVTALPVEHISAYLLKIEEGTAFASRKLHLPDEDETAALYLACVAGLEARGFAQYEISNFARDGQIARHNLKYWRLEPYWGFGPAAHSYDRGQRWYFPRDLEAFLTAEDPFATRIFDGVGGDAEEYAMLRLRLREGLDLRELVCLYPDVDVEDIRREAALLPGLVEGSGDVLRLTPEGFLLSNPITARLLRLL